jgi:hypothetical protein
MKNENNLNTVKCMNTPRQSPFATKITPKFNFIPLCRGSSNSDSSDDSFYFKETKCQHRK